MDPAALPHLDEHAVDVDAGRDAVWSALLTVLDRSFDGAVASAYARAVGCPDRTASGPRPLDVGSTVPGFRVTAARPGQELVLAGRHRFSTYALVFRLEDAGPGRPRLRAESRAVFPGPAGAAYRLLVLRTGAHVLGVRRLLEGVRRRAEAGSARKE